MLMEDEKTFSDNAERLAALSDRRQEITSLVCDGLSNKQIAKRLSVTEGTVKSHLHAIYEQLGVGSRIALMIALAHRNKPNSD
jgi:two-component system nitrate/nitrite response regulator NarL